MKQTRYTGYGITFSLCALVLVSLPSIATGQPAGSSREPFVLELPGVSSEQYTLPVVRLNVSEVPELKIRVLEPFASTIAYGAIVVTLNGEGINRGCSKSRDSLGKYAICGRRADRLGGYQILPGKNVLEVSATDAGGREFYASYVILLSVTPADKTSDQRKQPRPQRFTGRKFAVIVGVSEYKFNDAGLQSLDYADDDARSIAEFLRKPEGGGFLPADIKLLVDRDASLLALRATLADVARQARSGDLVFVFIAGHGAPDPLASQNLYFLFHDTKVAEMEKTGFPMSELKQWLDTKLAAHRAIVLIDTCHSAGVNQKTQSLITGRQLVQSGDENNISNFYLSKQLFNQNGRAILTSSDVNEVSRESKNWGNHGVFTWALLEGLKGKADLNSDGLITTGELFTFTRAEVQNATKLEQNPIALPGSAMNVVLAAVQKSSAK